MTKKKNRILVSLFGLLVVSILSITWFYPYSFFSIHRSYSFTPDPVVVDEYVTELNEFKRFIEKEAERNSIVPSLPRLYEQSWLVSKEPIKMDKENLSNLLLDIQHARQGLLAFLVEEELSQVQKQYIVSSIESFLLLEGEISNIANGSTESRKTLNILIRNLHVGLIDSFLLFKISIIYNER